MHQPVEPPILKDDRVEVIAAKLPAKLELHCFDGSVGTVLTVNRQYVARVRLDARGSLRAVEVSFPLSALKKLPPKKDGGS